MRAGRIVIISILAIVFCPASLAALSPPASRSNEQSEGWDSLRRVPHHATLIFADRDGNCVAGQIKSYDNNAIVVARQNERDAKIDRPNVLRIATNAWGPGVVYSGRSSWLDVEGLVPTRPSEKWRVPVRVEMNTGKTVRGQLLEASQEEITISSSARRTLVITKGEIARLSYIRPKPLSDSAEYANDELAWMKIFDPQLWPSLFHTQGSLVVRIYDANSPQDNAPIVCKAGTPWHTLTEPIP